MVRTRHLRAGLVAATLLLAITGCGDDGGSDDAGGGASPTSAEAAPGTTETASAPLTVLVTNDDGVDAEGIDAVASALAELDGVEVVVVAPAENQSGSADATTPGTLPRTETTTRSGIPAIAVEGEPADAVVVAIEELGIEPDLVVSGSNEGQNIGPLSQLSGTVGAAKVAARLGVPAVAISQGFGEPPDYPTGVDALLSWFDEHRAEIEAGTLGTGEITSINVPTCTTGEVRGIVEVPTAETDGGVNLLESDCTSTATDPADDVAAFTTGFIAIAPVAVG